jgi:hypothetical protein
VRIGFVGILDWLRYTVAVTRLVSYCVVRDAYCVFNSHDAGHNTHDDASGETDDKQALINKNSVNDAVFLVCQKEAKFVKSAEIIVKSGKDNVCQKVMT